MDFKIKINDKAYIINSEIIKYSKYLNELSSCQGEFNSDNSDKVIDSADYWKESEYFYIYEQN